MDGHAHGNPDRLKTTFVREVPVRFRVGDLVVDEGRCVVTRDGVELPVPRLSFDLLLELVRSAPNLVTIEQLMDRVWAGVVVNHETVSQRVKLLRTALGDSAEVPRYIASVRGRGYRLLVPVERVSADAVAPETPELSPAADAGPRRGATSIVIGAAIATIGVLGLALWMYGPGTDRARDEQPDERATGEPVQAAARSPSIAVLPLKNRSSRVEDAWFADGVHDDILTRLSQAGGIKVIARSSVERFRDTKLGIREIGTQLGVASVLEGSVQRDADRVRINLQLIDTATDSHLWAENYDVELTAGSLFSVQNRIAESVVKAMQANLTPAERQRMLKHSTDDLEAWESYQAAERLMSRRTTISLVEAEKRFDRAIELDPEFALAHAGRANAIMLQQYRGKLATESALARGQVSIDRALQLAPDLAEVVTAAAGIAETRGEYQQAEQGYRRAIELNPNYALAPHWLSALLLTSGKTREALDFAETAVRLDPYSITAILTVAEALEGLGRWDEALQNHLRAYDVDPENAITHFAIGHWFAGQGRLDLAIPWFERAAMLDPGNVEATDDLTWANFAVGRMDQAEAWRLETARRGSRSVDANAAVLKYFAGEFADGAKLAEQGLQEYPGDAWLLRILRNTDLAAGRPESARRRYLAAYPELAQTPLSDSLSVWIAVDAAFVESRLGNESRAGELLEFANRRLRSMQRLGWNGYGILDARIFAQQGNDEAAIAALHEAVREGVRRPEWNFVRNRDPAFASIRDSSEFKRILEQIDRDMAEQRSRLESRPSSAPLARSLD